MVGRIVLPVAARDRLVLLEGLDFLDLLRRTVPLVASGARILDRLVVEEDAALPGVEPDVGRR